MKSAFKMAALAASVAFLPAAAFAQAAAPAPAPAAAASNVAIADIEAAVTNSAAFQAAMAQIETTYKAQITAIQTRQTALNAELGVARTEIENLQKNPATPKATLDAKVAAFQAKGQAAQAELQRLAAPVQRPQAYVREQIEAKLEQAAKNAIPAKKVTVVVRPEATIFYNPSADITADIVTQLNALIPSASTTPPANWQPGAQGQQAAPAGR